VWLVGFEAQKVLALPLLLSRFSVVFGGQTTDFRDFESRLKIAYNSAKNRYDGN
jgi:hypothetical protein